MSSAQPGWYPDPQGFGTLRWFDGERWTEHRAPAPAAQPATPAQHTPFQPQPYALQGHQSPWTAQPPRPVPSGPAKPLIIVGAVLGTVVLVGAVSAIAIPAFLSARDAAERSDIQGLTCEQANDDAVRLSQEQTSSDMIALSSVSGSTMTVDNRDTVRTPAVGEEALVMTCEGDGLWDDGVTTRVWVEVWMLDDRSLEVGVTWDE